jgi:hypothetical protein
MILNSYRRDEEYNTVYKHKYNINVNDIKDLLVPLFRSLRFRYPEIGTEDTETSLN